ncbi:MAG: hypothetical protein JWM57_3962 [Phycisphaerales bacterium]|nr:hypothetical protein [Phycisphaerales bacterium]
MFKPTARGRSINSVKLQSEGAGVRHRRADAIGRAIDRSLIEQLEGRMIMAASPVITEFNASNSNGLVDGNGAHSDWIEIQNQGDAPIDLVGWHLTDDATKPAKWTFPSTTLNAGSYLVVFADSSTVTTPDSLGYLHTNFSLSADGENLSLRQPDGTVVSQFASGGLVYPQQVADVSYGTTRILNGTSLVVSGAPAKAFVPINSSLDAGQWTLPGYVDSTWKSGTTGVGYDGGGTASVASMLARWYAPSLNLANNATIQTWTALTGTGTAAQNTSANRPTYRTNQINGKAVVHFDGSNDQLKITNQSLNGLADFTVAMVFRTSTAGKEGTQWYNNTGIVDAEVGGVTNDWGLAINDGGEIGAGVGNPDTTLYSASNLNNGAAHTVVFTKTGTTTALSIDGGAPIYGSASATARNVGELVFGSIHTNINYFNGDLGEVRLYSSGLTDDAARSLSGEMGATWGVTQAAGLYKSKIGLDLQAEMANIASTANIRVPFTISGSAAGYDTLFLNMKYDDGFVAYLNGTEIARRNVAGGAITYTTTSTNTRKDSDALMAESIDVSSFVNLLQGNGATNILAIKAINVSAVDSDLLAIPELVAGTSTIGSAYMTTPTPGAANAPGYIGLATPVTASVSHGYFSSPFSTTLTNATPGTTIVYTLDGSTPTLTNGTQVLPPASGPTSVTLNISSTTVVRAVAFRTNYLPSNVTAASYFFTSDIVQQPELTPSGAYWDVGMDSDVVNAAQTYSVAQALKAIPTMSFSIDNADIFGSADGIYTHPFDKGDEWERKVSVEYFDPNNTAAQFSVNAGLRISGAVSRDPSRPKKSFKLFFRSEYGDADLNYPIFGTNSPQLVFDHLILRAGHSYSWANLGGTPYQRAEYLRDQFARDTQAALSGNASAGNFVQLYINGQYWGLYNTVEDVDQDFAAARFGGNAADYDVIKPDDVGGVAADDGTLDVWNNLFNTADDAYADGIIDATEYAGISAKVDTKGLVDYMLGVIYRGDNDAPVLIGSSTSPRNFIALVNRADPNAKMQFQTQDGEISLDNTGFDRTEVYGNQNPGRLYQQLRTNADFRQLVADEAYRAFNNNGPLTVAANQARYQALMAQINVAIVGESARWGNAKQSTAGMRDTDWVAETNWIINSYMPVRSNVVLTQLKNDFPELATNAPTINVNGLASNGGTIASGSSITLADTNSPTGAIYYTLDGTDPRAPGGVMSATAVLYSGALTLSQAKTLQARVLRSGIWSPLRNVAFTVAPPLLRLSEMMYHPATPAAGAPFTADEYEYIAVTNTGTTPINLGGMQLTAGVFGTIAAGTTLAPGARGVFVRNAAAFQYAYATTVPTLGVYADKLADSSERVTLFDPNSGTNIFDFTYVDQWYPTTDGPGYSLVVKDLAPSQAATTVLGVAAAWQASSTLGGTIGAYSTGATAISSVVIDDGTVQRSNVRTITINVSRAVAMAGIAAGAFTVTQLNGAITPTTATVSSVTPLAGGGTAIKLTLTQTGNSAASIVNGRYQIVINGAKIADTAGSLLDAAGTAVRGSSRTIAFYRMAGDADGNATVDFNDFLTLQNAFNSTVGSPSYNAGADVDGNGTVDFNDFLILQNSFNTTLPAAPAPKPVAIVKPTAPTKPATPVKPNAPVKSTTPIKPAAPVKPVTPVKPAVVVKLPTKR